MRVLIYGNFVDHQVSLAKYLSDGDEVLVMLQTQKVPERAQGSFRGESTVIALGRRGKSLRHPANIMAFLEAWKEVRRFRPDVVHMEVFGRFFELALSLVLRGYPLVMTFHDIELHKGEEWTRNSLFRAFMSSLADRIIVHGHAIKKQFAQRYPVPPDVIEVVPLGAPEFEAFKPFLSHDVNESGNTVLFFGRIFEYKGLQYLISAEPLITAAVPDAKIVIAGAGEDFGRYQRMMAGREDKFTVINRRISFEEGAELFQRCSVVVLPYVEASQSGVVTVAYGFAKPVVVTTVGSIPEVVQDGKTGLLVPPGDAHALAEAVIKLLRDKKLRTEMGANGRELLSTEMSWDRIVAETRRVYTEAMESRTGRSDTHSGAKEAH